MARQSLREISDVHAAIIEGGWDGELDTLEQAIKYRKKIMFRQGTKVRLVGTRNVEVDGMIGTVLKVNAKRITVRLDDDGRELLVPVSMLEIISPAPGTLLQVSRP